MTVERVLILNYEMDLDSPVLAWQASVASELSASTECVCVLTGRVGRFSPAPNLRVELFPPRPRSRLGSVAWFARVNALVLRLCREQRIDACFIHMAKDWAYVLAPAFRLGGVPVLLWYAHGTVTPQLRLAHACVDRVISSTPEGFRLRSPKLRVIGQGIDTDLFSIPAGRIPTKGLITVGRVSRRKRIDLLLEVMSHLADAGPNEDFELSVIGPPLTKEDELFLADVEARRSALGLQRQVHFLGFVPQERVPAFYRTAFLHINVSKTGSMDKTVLEALACGCPVLTSNEAFRELLRPFPEFVVHDERPQAIADQARRLYDRRDRYDPCDLRQLVLGKHDQRNFAARVLAQLEDIAR